jgi:YesN/AraC family two-component response regulator
MAKSTFPNLIISDIMMPVMNGIELCRCIKNDRETNHIPFVILTAKGGIQSKLEGVESGADYYFEKPLSVDLLELTLRNIFNQKSRLKEKLLKDHHTDIKEMVHDAKLKKFMDELIGTIESQLTNPEMNIDSICVEIGMSRTNLYNKIKGLTGQSIGDFIRTIRLRKAAQLLTEGEMSITEVMFCVGIQTQSYFTKVFKNEFGKTPSQFLRVASMEKQ